MSVEVIQNACAFQPQQQQQQQQVVKSSEGGSKQSPKHYALLEGKNDKLMQMEGMGIHTRHASVPDSLLLKGSAMNAAENGWSPAHERFTGMASNKPDLKHAAGVVLKFKKQSASNNKQMSNHNAASNGSRTTDEESVDYDSSLDNTSVSSFDFNRERAAAAAANANACSGSGGRTVVGALHPKPAPSKWDDAEKWLVSADAAALRGNKPKMQQLLSSIPAHVIINASKKAALLGQGRNNKMGSGMDVDGGGGEVDTKKIDTAGGPYKFSFMPSPGLHPKTRSMSSLDRYPLEELLACDQGKLKLVSVSSDHENMDDDMSKPALRTEKPTSDFPDGQMIEHGSGKVLDGARSPAASRETASYVTPPGLRSVSMRDMGTEMTPIASQEPSRTGTPLRATTPTIRSPVSSRPSTPGRGLPPPSASTKNNVNNDVNSTDCTNSAAQTPAPQHDLSEKQLQAKTRQEILTLGTQLGKANIAAWASREEEDEDASKCLKNIDLEEVKRNVLEARAFAWEEAEKAKYEARYKREEAKIIAWENHEKAKAEAEMRRIEVKVERMRSHSHEQLMNKLAVSHRKAEELRAAAEARRVEQAAKTAQRAEYIRQTGNMPPTSSSPLSIFLQLGRLCCR